MEVKQEGYEVDPRPKQEAVSADHSDDEGSISTGSAVDGEGESSSTRIKIDEGEEDDDDDDMFEDSLDLDLSHAETKMWLVRTPRFLMERWHDLGNIKDKDLGTVRLKQIPGQDGLEMRLILDDNETNTDIPHDYSITMTSQKVQNTYVFSERPVKGSKGDEPNVVGRPGSEASDKSDSQQASSSRYQPYGRTSARKTAIVGTVFHECSLIPSLRDQNYSKVVSQRRIAQSSAPRAKVTLLSDTPGVTAGNNMPNLRGKTSMFLRAQKPGTKPQQEKAIRLPKNELLDLLFRLFEEYDYWGMKGLRERTRQPESYLKEVLDSIAILNKRGPYALRYSLKPEYKRLKQNPQPAGQSSTSTEAANQADGGGEDEKVKNESGNNDNEGEGEDNDEVEMEDVL